MKSQTTGGFCSTLSGLYVACIKSSLQWSCYLQGDSIINFKTDKVLYYSVMVSFQICSSYIICMFIECVHMKKCVRLFRRIIFSLFHFNSCKSLNVEIQLKYLNSLIGIHICMICNHKDNI